VESLVLLLPEICHAKEWLEGVLIGNTPQCEARQRKPRRAKRNMPRSSKPKGTDVACDGERAKNIDDSRKSNSGNVAGRRRADVGNKDTAALSTAIGGASGLNNCTRGASDGLGRGLFV
jgi:hypothetical protein